MFPPTPHPFHTSLATRHTHRTTHFTHAHPLLSYGFWDRDALGLPSYTYTMDQLADSAEAAPPAPAGSQPQWSGYPNTVNKPDNDGNRARGPSEHSFMLGNDRLVVVGSNYGTFRVRQDEGGPKWLTDADVTNPGGHQYGGGFG